MVESGKLRVLLADDHDLFLKGMVSLLSSRAGIEVVGEAKDGREAIECARQSQPDLVLMDIRMPGCNGLEAVKVIKAEWPHIRVIMLSAFDDDDDLFTAILNGADGYLLKNLSASAFFQILDALAAGVTPFSSILSDRILQRYRKMEMAQGQPCALQAALTATEIDTLRLLARGESNKQIANSLRISEATVKLHVRNVMEKLNLENRTQLAVYAVREGLAEPSLA